MYIHNICYDSNIFQELWVNLVQWNPSCEATPFAPEKWPFKRGGLSSGVEINTFMFRFTLSSGLSRGVGLLSGWPLKRGFTVVFCKKNLVLLIILLPLDKILRFFCVVILKCLADTHTHTHTHTHTGELCCLAGQLLFELFQISVKTLISNI